MDLYQTNLCQHPLIPTVLVGALVLLIERFTTEIAWEEDGLDPMMIDI